MSGRCLNPIWLISSHFLTPAAVAAFDTLRRNPKLRSAIETTGRALLRHYQLLQRLAPSRQVAETFEPLPTAKRRCDPLGKGDEQEEPVGEPVVLLVWSEAEHRR